MNTSRERFERESARLRQQMAKRKVERLKEMKINWQRIALELRKHMPLEQASRKLGRHKDWLNQIASGEIKEPAFSDGLRLLDLACDKLSGDRLRELPLTFTQGVLCSLSILDGYGDSIAYREVANPHDPNQLWEEADEFDREHLARHGYRPRK